jgi:hypothetical protein
VGVDTNRASIDFTLGGLAVRLSSSGERWVARVGESVAVGRSARAALTLALEPLGPASTRALLADLALLQPSVDIARSERRPA